MNGQTMLWNIFRYDPATDTRHPLGRVRASNSGGAKLRAFKKYRIRANADQRRIGAEPVNPVSTAGIPLSEAERAVLRGQVSLLNRAIGRSAAP